MAVAKELLQMDLYALLGIEEKAADKEVRRWRGGPNPTGLEVLPALAPRQSWHPLSGFGRALGGE